MTLTIGSAVLVDIQMQLRPTSIACYSAVLNLTMRSVRHRSVIHHAQRCSLDYVPLLPEFMETPSPFGSMRNQKMRLLFRSTFIKMAIILVVQGKCTTAHFLIHLDGMIIIRDC